MTTPNIIDPATTTPPVAVASPSDPFADYEEIAPAWIAKPTASHLFASKKYVILVGWMDADFKYVEKYSQWWRSQGYTSIVLLSTSADMKRIANQTSKQTQNDKDETFTALLAYLTSQNLLEVLHTNPPTNSPKLAIHCFSNGGLFKLRLLLTAMHETKHQFKKACVILDSCPGAASSSSFAGLMSSGVKHPVAHAAAYWGSYVVGTAMVAAGSVSGAIAAHPITTSAHVASSQKNTTWSNVLGPRLFLYSDIDELVPCSAVQGHIAAAREEGVVVEEKMFVGSPHVKHAVVFKEEYWGAVATFVEKHA
ncbi:hypothetical protein HDU98_001855 [Podochytrium sp. JEL0797]|nr:hypothetical protein HDU98_001855 [Podochytrium sp. JEL0797]